MDIDELYGKYVVINFTCYDERGVAEQCTAQVKFEDEGVVLDVFRVDGDGDVIDTLGTTAQEYQEILEDG